MHSSTRSAPGSGPDAPPSARSDEILDSIRDVFIAHGFEGASMQTLARAAGMSAGNFYLYFSSKAAIIEAMVERDLNTMQADFDSVRDAPQPRERFRELVALHVAADACGPAPMMMEIEAAALRSADIAAVLRRFDAAVESNLAIVLARLAGVPELAENAHFSVHARTMMLLVRGMMACRRLATADDHGRNAALAAHVTGLIDSIVEQAITTFPSTAMGS